MNVNAFWQAVLDQNEKALPAYFADGAYVEWPCTNERFTAAEFIRANCVYPGRWQGEIERVQPTEDGLITAVHVYTSDGSSSFHVVSFLRLKDDKIVCMREYWGDDGPAPAWRAQMGLGRPLR